MSEENVYWLSLVSPYAYLATSRIDALSSPRGVKWRWRLLVLLPVFKKIGWRINPFADFPVKQAYMWRDVSRLAEEMGLPFQKPAHFPQNPVPATMVALAAFDCGFGEAFCRAVYTANFGCGRDITEPDVLQDLLDGFDGHNLRAARVIEDKDLAARIEENGECAIAKGLFGVPTFFVGDEMFWGNDRLQQAVDWAASKNRENPVG